MVLAIIYRYSSNAPRATILAIDKADKNVVRVVDKGEAASTMSMTMNTAGTAVTLTNTSASTVWGLLFFT